MSEIINIVGNPVLAKYEQQVADMKAELERLTASEEYALANLETTLKIETELRADNERLRARVADLEAEVDRALNFGYHYRNHTCNGMPQVLDMCCGPKMMWFDKNDDRAVFLDKRKERHAMNRPKRGTVEWTETAPEILCDFTSIPFENDVFEMVVFDPPHFERSGKIGYLAMKYGWLDGDWREMLRKGFLEGFRVLKPGGTLIFKWTDTENSVSEILKLTTMKPLFGHKSGKQSRTHWIAFLKPNPHLLDENQ